MRVLVHFILTYDMLNKMKTVHQNTEYLACRLLLTIFFSNPYRQETQACLQITSSNDAITIHPDQLMLPQQLFFQEAPKINQFELSHPQLSGEDLMNCRYHWVVKTKSADEEWRGDEMYFRLPSELKCLLICFCEY